MKLKRDGLIGTIIYHLLLLALLVFAGLTFPDPPPEEEGILVNFGTDDSGFGQEEPGGISDDQEPLPVVEETSDEVVEELVESIPEESYTPPTPTQPEPTPVDQTQDVEEVQVKEEPKPDPEELERQRLEQQRIQQEREEQERIEQERLEQERIERERREEAERIERERREEAERIERERKAKADRLRNMGQSAFENQGTGSGSGSEGVAGGTGNQGDPGGGDSDNYGTGQGLGNNGIGYGLEGRGQLSLPLPNISGCEVTQKMTVTVDIQVDRNGNVVQATIKNATYQDKCIWDMVVEAAKKSRFTAEQAAAYRQTGWIKYIITP